MKIEKSPDPWQWQGGVKLEVVVSIVMQEWNCTLAEALAIVEERIRKGNIFGLALPNGVINIFTEEAKEVRRTGGR